MRNFSLGTAKRYLMFLWVGAALAVIGGPVAGLYVEEINKSPVLVGLMAIGIVPTGLTYLALFGDAVRMLKHRLLFLLPLVFFPQALIFVIMAGPFCYLIYLTYWYRKLRKEAAASLS
ncbi:hypothetical protein KEM63_06345 [Halopseudomonas nanhaiensis]|uniref:hypothetical protein n=1 Tax=Halopseudomonas nanhaiensis TaxID=2830842 RepID=UPI001CBD3CBF|nr:hypothetical protein [Halopseudomonas nanhaiensis]UAW99582.1 hypothetical protein KEM63_06345 [Halopseudomonas nanhaiensis]